MWGTETETARIQIKEDADVTKTGSVAAFDGVAVVMETKPYRK